MLALAVSVGCKDKTAQEQAQAPTDTQQQSQAAPPSGAITGKVLETMDASGYTYVQLESDEGKIWAAGPKTQVKAGDEVTIMPTGNPIENFHSKTLERDFEKLYFASAIVHGKGDAAMAQMPSGGHGNMSPEEVDLTDIKKAEDGQTVAEIYKNKEELAGNKIKIRGKVVKALRQIMGKNWLHIQDGTGGSGTNDLVVTTPSEQANVGDTVVVSGMLTVDKDFGAGYKYDVIVEDAQITVE